jgi:hypothetical protein
MAAASGRRGHGADHAPVLAAVLQSEQVFYYDVGVWLEVDAYS